MVPDGHAILNDKVSRLYPTDDSPPQEAGKYVSSLSIMFFGVMDKLAEGDPGKSAGISKRNFQTYKKFKSSFLLNQNIF